jgi:hypothetical protein
MIACVQFVAVPCLLETVLPTAVVARTAGALEGMGRMIRGWLVVPTRCQSEKPEGDQPMKILRYQRRFVIAVVALGHLPPAT